MGRYKVILFDLDGTLSDPKEGITKSVQYALEKFDVVEPDLDKLESFIGPPLQVSFSEEYGFDEEKVQKAIEFYRERFVGKGMFENKLYPGMTQLLKELKDRGLKLIVATSKPTVFAEEILKYFEIECYFEKVVGSSLDGDRIAKSEVIQYILDQHKEDEKDTFVMIGDRKHDILGAHKAGIESIGVTYGYGSLEELRYANPTHIVEQVDQLHELLLENREQEFRGASAYDRPDFLANYLKRRGRLESPNNAIEKPIIYELMGDIRNQTILDLGCGDASFGKELLEQGAKSYTGVEGSAQMKALAAINLAGKSGRVYHATMETFAYPVTEFDRVTSRFAIHYVANLDHLFDQVYATLKEQGRFVFSVQHPLTTSSFISKSTGERRGNWVVDDYFLEGKRKEPWIEQLVIKYHRTIETYFRTLSKAGFSVVDLREGKPQREHFTTEEEFTRRRRIPLVLVFSCEKG